MDRSGFTLIELLIVIAIIVILGVVTTLNLQGQKNSSDLTVTTQEIATLLRQAQSDSVSQEQAAAWGVYFSNATATAPFYALFENTYSTSTTQGYYRLPPTVGYVSSSLALGATTSITFAQVSGVASRSSAIGLYLTAQPTISSNIKIASSGAISY
jgi:prepilin-type N-terminal cleavage/methylation domain-containing protein